MTPYTVTMRLVVKGASRADHFGRVVDRYSVLEEQHEALLDCAWGLSDQDTHGDLDVSVTVLADDEAQAWELACSSVRSAIHDAGGFTPDWTERISDAGVVAYRMTDEEVAPV